MSKYNPENCVFTVNGEVQEFNSNCDVVSNVIKTDELNHVYLNGYEFYEIENVSSNGTTYPWVIFKNDEYIKDVESCIDAINFCLEG